MGLTLLEAISRGEFMINGLRNKDLQRLLYTTSAQSVQESRRRSAAISRKLRLVRDHGLIQKIQKSYRYKVTKRGRQNPHRCDCRLQCHCEHVHSKGRLMKFVASEGRFDCQ